MRNNRKLLTMLVRRVATGTRGEKRRITAGADNISELATLLLAHSRFLARLCNAFPSIIRPVRLELVLKKNKILGANLAFRDQGCVQWPSSPAFCHAYQSRYNASPHSACKLGLLYSKGVAVASDIRYSITACMEIGKTR